MNNDQVSSAVNSGSNNLALILFIIFMIVAVFLILFISTALFRNIYFKKNTIFLENLKVQLQRDATKNKDAIQKCAILAKNEKTFEPICDSLKVKNTDITTMKDNILQHSFKIKSIIEEKKWLKAFKGKQELKKLLLDYSKEKANFNKIAEQFEIGWKIIDDVFTNYLEIVDYYKDILNKNKVITSNLNAELLDKVQKLAKRLSELDNSKYKGQFSQADKKIDELRSRLADLNNLILGASRIEYYLYNSLPNKLNNAIKKEKQDKIVQEYKKINQVLDEVTKNWTNYDSEKLASNIKLIYMEYWKVFHNVILLQKIDKFLKSIAKDLNLVYSNRKKLYNEVAKVTSKLNKAYFNLEAKAKALNSNKILDVKKNTQDFIQATKDFDIAYTNIKLELYRNGKVKIERENSIKKAIEIYFNVVENDFLYEDEIITRIKAEIINQYETNIKKYKSWAKHELVWNDFIHNLTFLTNAIATNEKYYQMYSEICIEVASNEKFLITNEKINSYKEYIQQIRIQIQQNNNYKEAYNSLKRFLIKEKYVQ
ncbi:hypothetical protein [Mycoplasmopsis verecunda]|uniref:Septation ring formation regulator n=1 Tax=Mycoplasmopsis verecunda TaxID=171291 RepID=A0A1T4L925_9BACT|nr:hypothetical protein [Mycoplasmopsis verecunda]WPB54482.1 hypothetical protein SAM46_03285 [Mycoplasmopsis verecunda]SJZ51272.1 hypothetical protein SAMN02745154_00377 [Mycoplasmopsis verecunda]